MNKINEFDLVVIGGGSGGVRAARIAAFHGARVALCEKKMEWEVLALYVDVFQKNYLFYSAQYQKIIRKLLVHMGGM